MNDSAVLETASLLENLDSIQSRIQSSDPIALFLDFDGTISQIVPNPGDAVIDRNIRPILDRILARPEFSLTVISGRALSDVRERANLPGAIYAGNHGLEIEAGATRFREPQAEILRRELRCLSLQLKLALGDTEGAEIEDKGLTLSVHYRGVNEAMRDWVRITARETIARSRSFSSRDGHMVLEVTPRVQWHKGYAVKWILREVLPARVLPIYIGDDLTDEDAFGAIPEGITIKVGELAGTKAQFVLPDVGSVAQFLQWLNDTKPHASRANSQRAGS